MLSLLMMFGMGSTNVYAAQPDETNTTLNVALYGYVPDTERFEKAVQESWEKAEPNVTLNFVNWDCYEEEPTENEVYKIELLMKQAKITTDDRKVTVAAKKRAEESGVPTAAIELSDGTIISLEHQRHCF